MGGKRGTSNDLGERFNLVTVADQNYVSFLACFLSSLVEQSPSDEPITVTVLHDGIRRQDRGALQSLIRHPHQISWRGLDTVVPATNITTEVADLPPTYWGLLAPLALPHVARIVYVDSDSIVTAPLGELWKRHLNGRTIAAVQDCLPLAQDAVANWEALGFLPTSPYFNAGMMVIDVPKWLASDVSSRVLLTCRENRTHLLAQGRWPQHEQYGLNVVLRDDWTRLPSYWNHWSFAQGGDHRIVHYLGGGKPALSGCRPEFRALFERTLARTPYCTVGLPEVVPPGW